MALRTDRPRSLLQDENAQANMVSGKPALQERKGLQPQQPHVPLARKKLSNITNQVLLQPKQAGKGTADKDSFAIRPDAHDATSMSTMKKTSRPPLKNISNGVANLLKDSSSKPPLKPKTEVKTQSQVPAPAIHLPPSSKLNLTDEMKKKAALWAEEGIERVHFTGEDVENLRRKLRDEEIAKRVAMVRNARIDIPFPRYPAPRNFGTDFNWKLPPDVLELDVLNDLQDDGDFELEGKGATDLNIDEGLFGCTDYLAVCSPPRFADGWPIVRDTISD